MSRTFKWIAPIVVGCVATTSCSGDEPTKQSAGGACAASLNTEITGPATAPVPDVSEPATAAFDLTIDLDSAAFNTAQREPLAEPLSVEVLDGPLRVAGGVKRFALHPERLLVELYLINDTQAGFRDLRAKFELAEGGEALRDLALDPLSEPLATPEVTVGGIAPEGMTRLRFGVDQAADAAQLKIRVDLSGRTTNRTSKSSSPIVEVPSAGEVWAVQPDAGVLVGVDTKSNQRVASIQLGGEPRSVDATADGQLLIAACSRCNQVVVVDRASREVVQRFGESDGVGREPEHVVVSPDGSRAYVSARVGDRVDVFERVADRFRYLKSVSVGRRPTGLSITPDSSRLFVAHFLPRGALDSNEAWLSSIDTASLSVSEEPTIRDDGNPDAAGCLSQVAAFAGEPAAQLGFEAVPSQLAGVFLNPGGWMAWVPGLRIAGFPIFEGDPSPLGFQFLALGANSPAMLFPMDTRNPARASFGRTPALVDITDRDEKFLECYPSIDDAEGVRVRDGNRASERIYPGVTIPSQGTLLSELGVARFVGWTRGGRRALVLSYVGDELAVTDGASFSPVAKRHLLLSGSNPTGIAVTADGTKGYVTYENSLYLSVLDLSAYADPTKQEPTLVPYRLDPGAAAGQGATIVTFQMLTRTVDGVPDVPDIREVAQVELALDPMDPVLRRGRILFDSSNPEKYPELSASRQAACASCHPGGGNDGTAWSTIEGERRTIGLWGGVAGRGWLHASATHRSVEDFATSIVTDRLGGTGLSESDVDALSQWVAHGIPERQRPVVDAARSRRGAKLFEQHCASCHSGPDGGDGNLDPRDAFGGGNAAGPTLHDVGTATDWAGVTLSTSYTRLFPPTAKKVLDRLRGDRALGADDYVQQTLAFAPRPTRARGFFKAPALTNTWENSAFFHDARFTSLDEVVEYFDATLKLGLTPDQRVDLVEYLKTR